MTNDNCRKFNENQIIFCTLSSVAECSRSVDFVDDRFRERGSLPATFYVLKGVTILKNQKIAQIKIFNFNK